jgi:hypothetical protein
MPKGIYNHKSGYKISKEKYISRSGENHHGWKGKEVGYVGLHRWIGKNFGKANHCDKCGADKIPKGKKYWFEWANKNGKFSRNKKDWIQLCIRCHRQYDEWYKKILDSYLKSKCWVHRKRDIRGKFSKK